MEQSTSDSDKTASIELSADCLQDFFLTHKNLFEALLSIEGMEDESSNANLCAEKAPEHFHLLSHSGSTPCQLKEEMVLLGKEALPSEDALVLDAYESDGENLSWKQRLSTLLLQNYAEIMDALAVTNEDLAKVAEPPKRLNALELRHNVKRCIAQSKPYMDTAAGVYDILTWKSPLFTIFMFWIYLCSIYQGYLVAIVLGILLAQLFINYLSYSRKISLGIIFLPRRDTTMIKFDLSGAQLIIELSRKMQICLEYAANCLEKLKNLFTWKIPRTTGCFAFLIAYWFTLSILLSTGWFFTVVGFGIGVKLFVTTYLFHRFPKLRHKFDVVVWFYDRTPAEKPLKLKTDMKNNGFSKFYDDQDDRISQKSIDSANSTKKCDSAKPVYKFTKKCVLFDSENSFPYNVGSGSMKVGEDEIVFKYSRINAGARDTLRIHFAEILSVEKARVFKWTNIGEGTSIEVHVAGRVKPYIFAGMFNRDECFKQLAEMGRNYGACWANG